MASGRLIWRKEHRVWTHLRLLVRLAASCMLVAVHGAAGFDPTPGLPASTPTEATTGGGALACDGRMPAIVNMTGPLSAKLAAACQAAGSDWPAGWNFIEAALVASGVENANELARWTDAYAPRRERIVQAVLHVPAEHRAARLHALLHEDILQGPYVRTASDLRLAIEHGSYNCLTSVALFFDLGQAAGMTMEIWTRPGHAYLKLRTARGPVPWEPGVPPVKGVLVARPAPDETSDAPGSLPPDGRKTPLLPPSRRLTPRQFLGRFYYNRAVEQLQAGQYPAALGLLSMSLTLDPTDADARQNYLAGLNNWAVASWRRGEVGFAVQLIQQGLKLEPTYGPLQANQRLLERKF
jgi:tetratricopeptide (TPR) repeat protein